MRFAKRAMLNSLPSLGKNETSYRYARKEIQDAYAFAMSDTIVTFYMITVQGQWRTCAPALGRRMAPLLIWQRALQKWGADFLKEEEDAK